MTREVIHKDVLLCDVCNELLVCECGHVLKPFAWTEWGLMCGKHTPSSTVYKRFAEREHVPKDHVLWAPLVFTEWKDF